MAVPAERKSAITGPRARVFFALWPDATTVRALHALSERAHAARGGRRMRRESLHLTLAFLGDVACERLPAVIEAGNRVVPRAFTLELDRLAAWRHNRIAWTGPSATPPELEALVKELNVALTEAGFSLEKRAFSPHITLLRNCRESLPPETVEPPIRWHVESLALIESRRDEAGSHYAPLRVWSARG